MDMTAYQSTGGAFFKATEVGDDRLTLTVADVTTTNAGDGTEKPVVSFEETLQELVLNKTNLGILVDAWGGDSDLWIGKALVLGTVDVQYQGKIVPGLRVKPVKDTPPKKGRAKAMTDEDIPF